EQQCTRIADEAGKCLFERFVRRTVSVEQVRCARTNAIAFDAGTRGGRNARLGSEAKIVVGGEGDEFAPFEPYPSTLTALETAAAAVEPRSVQGIQLGSERAFDCRAA